LRGKAEAPLYKTPRRPLAGNDGINPPEFKVTMNQSIQAFFSHLTLEPGSSLLSPTRSLA
jgi:hypothetical protein